MVLLEERRDILLSTLETSDVSMLQAIRMGPYGTNEAVRTILVSDASKTRQMSREGFDGGRSR